MPKARYYVYRLIDPRPGRGKPYKGNIDIYYVGEAVNWKARHQQHCERKKATTPAERRNQEIIEEGYLPHIEVIESFPTTLQALIHEIYYIVHYGKQGYHLLNREQIGYVYEQARILMGDARIHSEQLGKNRTKKQSRIQKRFDPVHELIAMGISQIEAQDLLALKWDNVDKSCRPESCEDFSAYVRGKIAVTQKLFEAGEIYDPAAFLITAIRENR